MAEKSALSGKNIMVLGMGRSGMGMARYLAAQGAQVTCHDARPVASWDEGFLSWAKEMEIGLLSGPELPPEAFEGAGIDLAVTSPGIPTDAPVIRQLQEAGIDLIGDLALSASLWRGRLIGITGTNGKTTTTKLLAFLLDQAGIEAVAAGNISPPLSEPALEGQDDKTAVLEISSFQLEYFPEPENWPAFLAPPLFSAAIWLNLESDHLDRHPDMEAYARAKAHLFDFLEAGALALVMEGLDALIDLPEGARLAIWPKEIKRGGDKDRDDGDRYFASLEQAGAHGHEVLTIRLPGRDLHETYHLGRWPLIGLHNIQNLAFALAAARWMGAERKRLEEALSGFKAPEHRLQEIGKVCGITFIDDSKATNVAATKSAISSLEREVILIAGGSYKAEEFHPLSELVCSEDRGWGISGAVLIGQEADRINEVLSPLVETCVIEAKGDGDGQGLSIMKEAVARAFDMARPGQSILLSPACASFDLFSGYKERAEAFRQAFRQLKLQKEAGGGRQGQKGSVYQAMDGRQGG